MSIYSPSYEVWEENGTQREQWTLDDRSASVQLRCYWSQRHLVAAEMLGLQVPWPHGGWAQPPLCQSISITPSGNAGAVIGQSIVYEHALLDVAYGFESEDLISESLEPTTEFITQDYRLFRWGAGDGDILTDQEAPGKLKRGLSLVRTIYNVSPPLPTSLLTLAGHVNDAAYTSQLLGLGFDKETLLFGVPNLSRTIRTDGSKGFTITMPFEVDPEGWNKFWRAKTGEYTEIFRVGENQPYKSYPLGSFAAFLF